MPGKFPYAPLLAAALLGISCAPAFADDDLTPRPQHVFSEKPRIEDYADYNAFLVDIMEYRRQRSERLARTKAIRPAQPVDDSALASVTGKDGADISDLYRVQGPESLEDALARAGKLPHPVYEEPERFGRTTSFSFPIAPMEGDDMSARDIEGNLQDLESANPEVYQNPAAAEQAATTLTDNPSNEDDARDKQAASGTDDAYRPSYDVASRTMTDSEGHTFWAPIYIKNEIGYTVIKVLEIEVSTFKN